MLLLKMINYILIVITE